MKLELATLQPFHVEHVVAHACADDRAELAAARIVRPLEVFSTAARDAVVSGCVLRDGVPVAIFGANPHPVDERVGLAWMIGTDGVRGTGRAGLAMSIETVDRMAAPFLRLTNWVHVEHRRALAWLTALGFTIDRRPTGPGGAFYPFWLEVRCV